MGVLQGHSELDGEHRIFNGVRCQQLAELIRWTHLNRPAGCCSAKNLQAPCSPLLHPSLAEEPNQKKSNSPPPTD